MVLVNKLKGKDLSKICIDHRLPLYCKPGWCSGYSVGSGVEGLGLKSHLAIRLPGDFGLLILM